jgi:dipeptidyl aminopeptidase/acylaminoacyl peptidase
MHRGIRLIALAVLICAAFLAFAQKRSITEKDLFQFNWIGDPQISPDGSRVAFVKVTVNDKKDGYDTSLWSVAMAGNEQPRRMTSGNHDASPRWSPDGKWLAFVRTPEASSAPSSGPGAGKPPSPQIYLLPMTGGESWRVTDLPRGASNPVWSPDSKIIAFSSTTSSDDLAKQRKSEQRGRAGAKPDGKSDSKPETSPEKDEAKTEKPSGQESEEGGAARSSGATDAEHESDVKVITRAVYRLNGVGYLDPRHTQHIWVISVAQGAEDTGKPKQLTSGPFDESNIIWSKDGSQIYFTTTRVAEPYYELPHSDIYSVAATGGEPTKLLALNVAASELALSPDGKRMAFCGSVNEPVHSYTQPDLWVVDLSPGARPRNLTTSYDFDMCSGVGGDQGTPRAGGPNEVIWSHDGNSLITTSARQGKANLVQVEIASGKVTEITTGNQAVERYRTTEEGSKLVAVISTPINIGDLFVLETDKSGRQPAQITHINDKLFSQLNITAPEEIWYNSFDGKRIEAWIQKPPDFNPARKYPLILNIHGGPHGAYGYVFDHEFQWMAAKGYVVLYPNPRGSTSYGQDFGNIIQYHYPGDDFRDLMTGVDEMLKRGYIDPKKLGVTGGSGGGLLTDWVVGHTDRFAAAVAQRDIASWAAWWYSADFTLFEPSWFKAPPFQDPQDYVNRSPITYIQNVKTPLMLVLGEADYRTPPGAGGEEMFRALKFLKRPVIMVRFPGESHELSRSGQPWHRTERLEHIVGWFDKYLMGMRKPEYDDVTGGEVSVKPNALPASKQNPAQPPQLDDED